MVKSAHDCLWNTRLGFESWQAFFLDHNVQTGSVVLWALYSGVGGYSGQIVKLTTHIHLVLRLRI
jgi:hypothetical protein